MIMQEFLYILQNVIVSISAKTWYYESAICDYLHNSREDGVELKNNSRKKELQSQYNEREIVGGVYLIRNTINNKLLLDSSTDIQGSKNRFEFAQKTGSCVTPKLQKDWTEHGASPFVFEVLDELKKNETQSPAEFKTDINLLTEIWREKLSGEEMY
jgi:hypothetical protein